MTRFEVCDLVVAASRTLDLDTGATLDLLDLAAAETAVAEARAGALAAGDDPASAAAAQVLACLGADPGRLREQVGRLAAVARRDGTQPGGDQQSA